MKLQLLFEETKISIISLIRTMRQYYELDIVDLNTIPDWRLEHEVFREGDPSVRYLFSINVGDCKDHIFHDDCKEYNNITILSWNGNIVCIPIENGINYVIENIKRIVNRDIQSRKIHYNEPDRDQLINNPNEDAW